MKFIITYWSQITILLLGIGFIIQKIIDYKLKLKEVKFNTFHIERANFIREIYSDLIVLQEDLDFLNIVHTTSSPKLLSFPEEEWIPIISKIVKQNKLIKQKVLKCKILFSSKFTNKLDDLFTIILNEFIMNSLDNRIRVGETNYTFSDSDRFQKYYKIHFPKLIRSLEKDFRKYL